MDKLQIMDVLLYKYIQDPKNRAIQDGIPRYVTCDNRKCPLGSVLKNKALYETFGNAFALISNAFNLLPGGSAKHVSYLPPGIVETYYDGHQTNFWNDLILFHDTDKFYTETGLSEEGKKYLNFLEQKWDGMKHPKT